MRLIDDVSRFLSHLVGRVEVGIDYWLPIVLHDSGAKTGTAELHFYKITQRVSIAAQSKIAI